MGIIAKISETLNSEPINWIYIYIYIYIYIAVGLC